jgi:hypothetical protein
LKLETIQTNIFKPYENVSVIEGYNNKNLKINFFFISRVVRLLRQRKDCGRQPDCKVEETGEQLTIENFYTEIKLNVLCNKFDEKRSANHFL